MSKSEHFERYTTTNDHIKLYSQGWIPKEKPKAIICLIHGIGEHSGRYQHWAERFNNKGFIFVGPDLRGHGKSGGKRGHTPSMQHFINDINIIRTDIKKQFPNLPLIIYGHSMGGNISLNYILNNHNTFDAAIISSPWIKLYKEPSQITVSLARLAKYIVPGLLLNNSLNISYISRDPKQIKKYSKDIYVHNKISVSTFVELMNSAEWVLKNSNNLKTPCIFIHGTGDKITSHKATEEFVNATGNKSVMKILEGLYHETHNEPEQEDVFNFLITQLDKLKLYSDESI